MAEKLKLTFCGGANTVTGANFLLESVDSKILVDCGLEQGGQGARLFNRQAFPYDPKEIDVLLVTHAHMDHIGRIPKLIKEGFKGKIYSTPETLELAGPMLEDALKLLTQEAAKEGVLPLYEEKDMKESFNFWSPVSYHQNFEILPGFSIYLKNAGHVLGSAICEITHNGKKIVFTGDLGNSPSPLIPDTEEITDADYLLMESVYGDRNHEPTDLRMAKFESTIKDTIAKKGVLVIPVFSLEKTQIMIYELNNFIESKKVPMLPVYIDSPLATRLTEIYKRHPESLKPSVQEAIKKGDDIFNFPKLHFVGTSEESRQILHLPNPKIILAGSGMSTGGRVQHHEINYLSDPKNTILFIGYQTAGTLGRQIQDGAKKVRILEQDVVVRAKVVKIDGFSSHKDSDHLIEFVEKTAEKVKKVFVVMGETKSALFLVQRLRDYLNVDAYHPKQGESVELDF